METKKEIETFCHNVAWLRAARGLSKREMAKVMGIGVESLNKLERGELPPNLRAPVLYALRDYFGVSTSMLFGHWMGE